MKILVVLPSPPVEICKIQTQLLLALTDIHLYLILWCRVSANQLQVFLSMCDLLVDTSHYVSINLYLYYSI